MVDQRAPGAMGLMALSLAEQRQKAREGARSNLNRMFDDDELEESTPASVVSAPEPKSVPAPVQEKKPAASKESDTLLYWINPEDITPWELADRPDDEFGDMSELTESIRAYGQEVPALLRPIAGKKGKYELIYGRRRWTACLDLGIPVKAFIRAMDDEEAFKRMYIENAKRNDLSAWAKAQSWQRAIDKGIYKNESALAAKLGIHRGTVNNIMAFNRIPKEIVVAIGKNMKSVGIHTAKALSQLDNPEEITAAVEIADKIGAGQIVAENVTKIIKNRVAPANDAEIDTRSRVITDDKGTKLFTVRTTGRGATELTFTSEALKRHPIDELITKIKGVF